MVMYATADEHLQDLGRTLLSTPCIHIWMGNPEHGMWNRPHSRFPIQILGAKSGVLSMESNMH